MKSISEPRPGGDEIELGEEHPALLLGKVTARKLLRG